MTGSRDGAPGTGPFDTVIFSLDNGVVWAHLPDGAEAIALGDFEGVTYMMRDFLAQCELGDRLASFES